MSKKRIIRASREVIRQRVKKMVELKKKYIERISKEGYEVVLQEMKLQDGNTKTGKCVKTLSFIPIHDCINTPCSYECYDAQHDCQRPSVINDRARNSALKEVNPIRFWEHVAELIKADCVEKLRLTVGGDLKEEDFMYIDKYLGACNKCKIFFFTKNYEGLAQHLYYCDNNEMSENIHPLLSAWPGLEMYNPYNLPVAHVLFRDGSTTAPEFGSHYCQGCCSRCFYDDEGCPSLNKGESVLFAEH